ncbi:MAG: isoprenylcysteine carboxylmethyltransferase family protein [Cyanobacteria bacterium KgW148]|nr:isoprenylcysteine carboxylmethyltransferase family protein [Cyanobacteria bacterium KgW148]
MNQLQTWGFRRDWWRNQRGEFWVIGQTILSIAFILTPVIRIYTIPMMIRLGGTIVFGAIALGLGLGGLLHLGDNLTPLPHPKDESSLVTVGVYRFVRHPIYSSVIFLTLAYATWQMSISHTIGVFIFLLFFDQKARQEEQWLTTKFPEYEEYKRSVKKILPGIY